MSGRTDLELVALWLHGKSNNTRDAYDRDVRQFFSFVGLPLSAVTLEHIQAYSTQLAGLQQSTRARKLAAVKSMFTFAVQIGHLKRNVAAVVKSQPLRDSLAERILSEDEVSYMLAAERDPQNRLILSVLYFTGIRVSELCSLDQGDVIRQRAGFQLSVFGKGGSTRQILLPTHLGKQLSSLTSPGARSSPLFMNRSGTSRLNRTQVYRIVRRAALAAGLHKPVSPHWLRHAHASHALDNGAPPHLVQSTLGHKSLATTGRYAHAHPKDSSTRFIRPLD